MNIFVKVFTKVSFPRFILPLFATVCAVVAVSCGPKNSYYEAFRKDLHLTQDEMSSLYGEDTESAEFLLGLAIESRDGNWEKVAEMVSVDRKSKYGTYYYNLCNALNGCLPERLMDYYQPFTEGLFLPVSDKVSPFQMSLASEVWFQLGDMTMAEHANMLGMIFSPHHDGDMFLKRMAEINLIKGDDAAAVKYLNMLLKRRDCREWAIQRMPGKQSEDYMLWLVGQRLRLPQGDAVHFAGEVHASLRALIESNPSNKMARDYLLCYELLAKDISSFAEDYDPDMGVSPIYSQAILAWLVNANILNQENISKYHITQEIFNQFKDYTSLYATGKHQEISKKYSKTYWFFYHYAQRKEK